MSRELDESLEAHDEQGTNRADKPASLQRLRPSDQYTQWRDKEVSEQLDGILESIDLDVMVKRRLKVLLMRQFASERNLAVGHAVLGTAFETTDATQE